MIPTVLYDTNCILCTNNRTDPGAHVHVTHTQANIEITHEHMRTRTESTCENRGARRRRAPEAVCVCVGRTKEQTWRCVSVCGCERMWMCQRTSRAAGSQVSHRHAQACCGACASAPPPPAHTCVKTCASAPLPPAMCVSAAPPPPCGTYYVGDRR